MTDEAVRQEAQGVGTPPPRPMIYHITHVDNLPAIIAAGGLLSDAAMTERGGPASTIGISGIKELRLRHPADCHPGDFVGDFVPFYFCPRSVMLFVIARGNHPSLSYRGGQGPIVHLEAELSEVVDWADAGAVRWAFCATNAGAGYTTRFLNRMSDLDQLDWASIGERDFRRPEVKEGKQAEFLVHQSLPWSLVSRVGVCSAELRERVEMILQQSSHRPIVSVQPDWYF